MSIATYIVVDSTRFRRFIRLSLAVVVLPHELAHAMAIRPWTDELHIDVDPTQDGRFRNRGIDRPVARFNATVPPTTPAWAVRLCAVAPLVVFLGAAVVLEYLIAPSGISPGTLTGTAAIATWGSLSDGDIAVFLAPAAVVENGEFLLTNGNTWAGPVSTGVTVAVTAITALLFLA